MKIRYIQKPWHDENLVITRWGLTQMRTLIIVGFFLGLAMGWVIWG